MIFLSKHGTERFSFGDKAYALDGFGNILFPRLHVGCDISVLGKRPSTNLSGIISCCEHIVQHIYLLTQQIKTWWFRQPLVAPAVFSCNQATVPKLNLLS